MESNTKILLGLGLLGAAAWGGGLLGAASKLQVGSIKMVGKTIHLTYANIQLQIPITNPTKKELPFRGFNGGAYWGETKLANIEIPPQGNVKAGETVTYNIVVRVDYLQAAQNVINIISSMNFLQNFFLRGTIKSIVNVSINKKVL